MVACIPSHRSAGPDSLVIRLDFGDRGELVAAAPDAYNLPDHYAVMRITARSMDWSWRPDLSEKSELETCHRRSPGAVPGRQTAE